MKILKKSNVHCFEYIISGTGTIVTKNGKFKPWIVIGAILCGVAINFVPDALPATSAIAAAGHSLSAVHWASAAFLAAMIAYNLVRPVSMGHHKCSSK